MLREELRLAVHQLGGMGFERCGDLRVQLLAGAAQQAAMRRVLHQRVLEAIDRVGRHATLEDQLGRDEPVESGLQLVFGKAGNGVQQRVGKLASDRRADLRHMEADRERGRAERAEQGRDSERARADALRDKIDGLQTRVATAEAEAETARTAAREAAHAAETLRKAEAELRARGLWARIGPIEFGELAGST
jgi:hypothetical protein